MNVLCTWYICDYIIHYINILDGSFSWISDETREGDILCQFSKYAIETYLIPDSYHLYQHIHYIDCQTSLRHYTDDSANPGIPYHWSRFIPHGSRWYSEWNGVYRDSGSAWITITVHNNSLCVDKSKYVFVKCSDFSCDIYVNN